MTDTSRIPTLEDPNADRPVGPALLNGWRRRCPNCGQGRLLEGYLTVRPECPECGEPLHHQRADDGPAWATIVVAGKLLAPMMLFTWETWRPEPLVMALSLCTFFTALCLYLLPRFKGMFVNLQWSRRMHGFGGEPDLPMQP
jgi:uncharacterized protein (DUF983 family)